MEKVILPVGPDAGPEAEWLAFLREIRRLALDPRQDPRGFLRWEIIAFTMAVNRPTYVRTELAQLRADPAWSTRWAPALVEDAAGRPRRLSRERFTSGSLVDHAYHVWRFEHATGLSVSRDFDTVAEFGGGYGGFARLFRRLGFEGRIHIHDWSMIGALQRFWFGLVEVGGRPVGEIETSAELSEFGRAVEEGGRTLFIAMWSLSEAAPAVREEVRPRVEGAAGHLIGYQEHFAGHDNAGAFEEWQKLQPDVEWIDQSIAHQPGQRYLFGVRA